MAASQTTDTGGTEKAPGFVYTFYSYKGGVGRSMALANVAVCMALAGKKLLLIDWDLEAPGLEVFFQSSKGCVLEGDPTKLPGLVDLLEPKEKERTLDWRKCLLKAKFLGKSIDILSAGRRSDDYRQRVQQLDWSTQYGEEHRIGNFIDGLRNEWRQAYDFVLVDSRTGITDIGDICTVLLPDALVFLFVSNRQNIDGIKTVMQRATKARNKLPVNRNRLIAVPLPSRDEIYNENEKAMEWRNKYVEELGFLFHDWLPKEVSPADAMNKLFIPYVTIWSFGERIPVLESSRETQDPTTIGAAYQRVATLLSNRLSWYSLEERASAAEIQGTRVELEKARADALAKQDEIDSYTARRKSAWKYSIAGTLAAVLILASIAIPSYQDYTIRGQITEGLNLSAAVKASLAEDFASRGVFPSSNKEAGLPDAATLNGKFVTSVSVGKEAVISVRYGNESNSNIANKALLLTPRLTSNDDVFWICSSAEIESKYLPTNCRPEQNTPGVALHPIPSGAAVVDRACLEKSLAVLVAEESFSKVGGIACQSARASGIDVSRSSRVTYTAPAGFFVQDGVRTERLSSIGGSHGPVEYSPASGPYTSVSVALDCKGDGGLAGTMRLRLTGKISRAVSDEQRAAASKACTGQAGVRP